jgi:hypothetical protein
MEPKKRSLGAAERDEFLRAAWRAFVAEKIDAERLVFVDEMGSNTSFAALYAWSRRGDRARCTVPRNRGKNTTLLASMTSEGVGLGWRWSEARPRRSSRPTSVGSSPPALRPGQVVVLDNLGAHKGERVRELIEERGCELLFLPPYSPDLNPTEEAFSKVKGLLRRAGARTRKALVEAMGRALDAVTIEDTQGFFEHCGYRFSAQSL